MTDREILHENRDNDNVSIFKLLVRRVRSGYQIFHADDGDSHCIDNRYGCCAEFEDVHNFHDAHDHDCHGRSSSDYSWMV
jgi:hypothetical protein